MNYKSVLLLIAIMTLCCCDSRYQIAIKIDNKTNTKITAINTKRYIPCGISTWGAEIDTLLIPEDTMFRITACSELGLWFQGRKIVKNYSRTAYFDSTLLFYANGRQIEAH